MLVKPAENQFSLYCTKNARLQALVFASADVFFDMRGTIQEIDVPTPTARRSKPISLFRSYFFLLFTVKYSVSP